MHGGTSRLKVPWSIRPSPTARRLLGCSADCTSAERRCPVGSPRDLPELSIFRKGSWLGLLESWLQGGGNGQKRLPRLGCCYPHILSATTVTSAGNFEGALTFCLPREPQKPIPPPTHLPDPPGRLHGGVDPRSCGFSLPNARLLLTCQVHLSCLWGTTPPHSWPITDSTPFQA